MNSRYIDLHLIQDVPISCLNRGEDNEPKTILIGGRTRGALSSQSVKRADRMDIEDALGEPAARTRLIPPRLAKHLRQDGWPDDLARFAGAQLARCATKEGLPTDPENDGRTLAMLYVPTTNLLDDLAALCQTHRPALEKGHTLEQKKKNAKTSAGNTKKEGPAAYLPAEQVVTLLTGRTATISLFGRFLAGLTDAHVPGAVQMAWAFTTHASDFQPDFYTAYEDWASPGESASAHLDTAFLNAGVFYRYSSVNLTELTSNLDGDHQLALDLLRLYAETFILTLPKAKQNSTAPHTLPDLVHFVVRDRRPVSYAPAFHQPVKAAPGGGFLSPSRQALSQHAAATNQFIGTRHRVGHGHATLAPDPVDHLGPRHDGIDDLLDALTTASRQDPS